MHKHKDRLWPEAALLEAGEDGRLGEAIRRLGYLPLSTLAKRPEVIAAVNRARRVADKARFAELCRHWEPTEDELAAVAGVLDMLPGYCSFNDAASIAARL